MLRGNRGGGGPSSKGGKGRERTLRGDERIEKMSSLRMIQPERRKIALDSNRSPPQNQTPLGAKAGPV